MKIKHLKTQTKTIICSQILQTPESTLSGIRNFELNMDLSHIHLAVGKSPFCLHKIVHHKCFAGFLLY